MFDARIPEASPSEPPLVQHAAQDGGPPFNEPHFNEYLAPPKKHWAAGLLNGLFRTRLDKSSKRIRLVACAFGALYLVIGGKLVYLAFKPDPQTLRQSGIGVTKERRCTRLGQVTRAGTDLRGLG